MLTLAFGMGNGTEWIIIGAVAILLFGTSKVAGMGKALGSSIRDFKKALHEEEESPSPILVELSSLSIAPTSVVGGASAAGTVTLINAAPAGGTVVTLSSGEAVCTVPISLTIAAGTTSAAFTITTSLVTAGTSCDITARYNGISKTANLTVTVE